ncbi:hypothetical protein MMC26_004021 [Xylographa opegraphella]|nr:hypothetical protein [Xylographa opegraphella]
MSAATDEPTARNEKKPEYLVKESGSEDIPSENVIEPAVQDIDYNSYVLYLQAIARALQGVFTIILTGVADYSNYRKRIMLSCILIYGALALPYAGLFNDSYTVLTVSAVLFALINTVQGAYGALEFSYIPLFMRAAAISTTTSQALHSQIHEDSISKPEIERQPFNKGVQVAVSALVVGNVGSLVALLIGVIITYARPSTVAASYHSFLIAITVAGAMTVILGFVAGILLPSVPGKRRQSSNPLLPFHNWLRLLGKIRQYPEPFKLCAGWILWNTGWANQLSLIGLLFREVLGLNTSSGVYTTWTFTSVIFATLGSLAWLYAFPRTRLGLKAWAYVFLGVQLFCIVWGCIGISNSAAVGFKHAPEFWVEQALFMSSSSALRALNRMLYASMLPRGSEALFFGLEIVLDLATGWINPLLLGTIQNATHNLRFPMVINALLVLVAVGFYAWVDVGKGVRDAEVDYE